MESAAKTLRTLGLVAFAGMASPSAVAEDSGWYVGANIGQSRAKIDDERISSSLLGAGLTTTSITDDDRDLGYKLFGGYQFNRYFSLESGYFDLGKFGFTATTAPPGTLNGNIKLKGLNVDAVATLPITEKFSALGRVGLNYAEAKDAFSGTGSVSVINPNSSKRAANYKVGLGLQYDFTKAFGMRAEAERYRIDDGVGNKGDIDLFSLGLVYRFGKKTSAPAPIAEEPPTELVPAPAPRPVAVMPLPEPTKVTFSANVLFDFDQAAVKPAGKQALDKFAADLRSANYDVITVTTVASVTGHTDRIGAPDYNMRLSTRRAEAVKAYLVEVAGVPAGKIKAIGTDGSDPVTKPGECKGEAVTQELIDCLQPDRRVEVELSDAK